MHVWDFFMHLSASTLHTFSTGMKEKMDVFSTQEVPVSMAFSHEASIKSVCLCVCVRAHAGQD